MGAQPRLTESQLKRLQGDYWVAKARLERWKYEREKFSDQLRKIEERFWETFEKSDLKKIRVLLDKIESKSKRIEAAKVSVRLLGIRAKIPYQTRRP